MPYVSDQGVRIYYEVEGKGPSLVLAHGVGGNLNQWRRVGGYLDALKNDFQLILFDARGHGRSDKPHDPAAYGSRMTDDVVSILDDMGIRKAHYFGYSMGARIGFYVATIHADRFLSFALGGAGVIDEATARARAEVTRTIANMRKGSEGGLATLERQLGRPLTSEEKEERLANDPEALLALRSALSNMPTLTKEYLSLISVPCLLYCGDADPRYTGTKEAAGYIPHAKFVSLPGLDHGPAFARSDLIVPYVKDFLTTVGKT